MDRLYIPVMFLVGLSAAACGPTDNNTSGDAGNTVGGGEGGGSGGFDAGVSPGIDAAIDVVSAGGDADDGGSSLPNADGSTPPDDGGSSGDSPYSSEAGALDGGHGNKILIYTLVAGSIGGAPAYVHASIPATAMGLSNAATAAGLVPEISKDPTKFNPGGLSQYAAVVLVATAGEPLGPSPATAQIQTLIDFVRAGGGLVGIENAVHCAYTNASYYSLLGTTMVFGSHSAFGSATCSPMGTNPSAVGLPPSFPLPVNDEIYYFHMLRADDQIVLQCSQSPGTVPLRPVAWVRTEGLGRVFYTSLGHDSAAWIDTPGNPSLLVHKHVFPGLLWTIGR
jgi:type 1 glutamine amidotransferase